MGGGIEDRPSHSAVDQDVVVAVLTYRRPEGLRRIVPALVDQAKRLVPAATVLVIDNDPDGSAAALVAGLGYDTVRYVHEPRAGIAAARNRALEEAAGSDVLVFIDDDEMPSENWLASLVSAFRSWACAAVSGPVVARFDTPPDPWIAACGVFDRRVHRTGDTVRGGATNNLLLDLHTIRRLGLRFDERLGLVGGEDTMFSHRLTALGGVIRWCDEAEVIEPVAPDRLNRRWALRRAYRAGSSWSRAELALTGSGVDRTRCRALLIGRGVLKFGWGATRVLVGILTHDVRRQARGAFESASYAGLTMGALGFTLEEYSRR